MKLALDLQACQTDSRHRGIGRYALSLTAAMAASAGDDTMTVLLDAADPTRLTDVRQKLRQARLPVDTATFGYPASLQGTDLHPALVDAAGTLKSRLVESLAPDMLLVSSFFEVGERYTTHYDWDALPGVPRAVIAYDLIPALFPEQYLPPGHFVTDWYRGKLERFKQFDLFLAISEVTRRDLIEQLGIAPERIVFIGAGLDDVFFDHRRVAHPRPDATLRALGITQPFVLMVGNADWRKNSIGALDAFAALPAALRDAHQLVFTRVGPDVQDALNGRHKHLRRQVVIAGSVDEDVLGLLYSRCKVFFFPSYYEGFGLPVLEAMAWGAPVLSSSLGALPEVVRDPRVLFDPRDLRAASAILARALGDDAFRASLADGAAAHAHTFTWERAAQRTWAALRAHARPAAPRPRWIAEANEVSRFADAVQAIGPAGMDSLHAALACIATGARRRILVDITEVVRLDARSGIQRVVRNYCTGLLALAHETGAFDVAPVCWTETGVIHPRRFVRERLGVDCPGDDTPVAAARNDILFMVDSSWWSPERFDELHAQVRAVGGEVVWMVYDLIPARLPALCDPVMPPVFTRWLAHVARGTDGCICISDATRHDLDAWLRTNVPAGGYLPWTRTVHLGGDLESGRRDAPGSAVRELVAAAGGALFAAVGTIEPRKDYATILDAFERGWAAGDTSQLVLIGKQGWNVEALVRRLQQHPERGQRLHWLDNASDGDVLHLLTHATALIQASLAEGFGLPVIEAAALGVPLLLSDLPVFREVAGAQATYFRAGDARALHDAISAGLQQGTWLAPTGIRALSWRESTQALAAALLR